MDQTNKYKIYNFFYEKINSGIEIEYNHVQCLLELFLKSSQDDVEKQLLKSLVDEDAFLKKIKHQNFLEYIDAFTNIIYIDDANELENCIINATNDPAQLYTIKRIMQKKINLMHRVCFIKCAKLCPHCSKKCIEHENIDYIVCGYSSRSGYDWEGCGYDWCFHCGKKLCKQWNKDQLYNKFNRFHNDKCCRKASKNRSEYLNEYCQCNNMYVRRNVKKIYS